jgi:phage/plasmid-associated DNA primase
VLAAFITDCCTEGPRCETTHADLYKAYSAWSDQYGERAMSSRAFSQQLTERGYTSMRGYANRAEWKGIGLVSPQDDEPARSWQAPV